MARLSAVVVSLRVGVLMIGPDHWDLTDSSHRGLTDSMYLTRLRNERQSLLVTARAAQSPLHTFNTIQKVTSVRRKKKKKRSQQWSSGCLAFHYVGSVDGA